MLFKMSYKLNHKHLCQAAHVQAQKNRLCKCQPAYVQAQKNRLYGYHSSWCLHFVSRQIWKVQDKNKVTGHLEYNFTELVTNLASFTLSTALISSYTPLEFSIAVSVDGSNQGFIDSSVVKPAHIIFPLQVLPLYVFLNFLTYLLIN